MSEIKILIIDDEPLARDLIRTYLSSHKDLVIVGECENGFEGFKLINELQPDIIFLDVMMPKLTGFEMLELIEDPPVVIFSTAYDEYAIKAFEANAIDYLLKPYDKDRFDEAITKAKRNVEYRKESPQMVNNYTVDFDKEEVLNRVAVRTGSKINIIAVDEIQYLEALDDYVKIHSSIGIFVKQNTMKYYETHLSDDEFVRIHRSYILRIKEMARIEPMGKDTHVVVLHDGKELPVSRTGYSKLREMLGF